MFSFQKWNSQLRLGYSRKKGTVLELLKVGAPDEVSPLFSFKTVGVPHHPRVVFPGHCELNWRLVLRGGCGPEEGGYFGMSEIVQ